MLLILDRPGLSLGYERASLLIRDEDGRKRSVPVRQLERVVVGPRLELGAGVLGLLAQHGVPLLVLNHRHPERTAELVAYRHGDARRRLAQYALFQQPQLRERWARGVVALKVQRQRALLARAREERPGLRLGPVLRRLEALEQRLATETEGRSLASLRGIEGAAGAAFFEGYGQLFAPALGFEGRRRRPPPDPVNACLSLGYTLLHAEASGAARVAGLDPMLGGFHEPSHGQDALASDLVEPLRPAVEGWVWELFRAQTLRREHFQVEDGACLLRHHAQAVFYEAAHEKLRVWRRVLRGYARRFAALLPAPAESAP
ncbi:CRISP-associated protein Cas1 [Methylomagnum ishizawai]|uniref:CRISPR-associated endonuclease Cas1 n=1 Tax=Methylomagnum ishizawai TaxID=1760988 RepID=A0A1Y6D1Z9_9GAMM|nr:CRISPR-associated endonuclease Cas1 [Methylomagnum ishizawai]SMF96969.1 CRISP-associated protein Cas1 [Methylomagnum ishizawai]